MNEYPKMLYRKGKEVALQNGAYDLLTVDNEAAEDEARLQGWHSYGETPAKQDEGDVALTSTTLAWGEKP